MVNRFCTNLEETKPDESEAGVKTGTEVYKHAKIVHKQCVRINVGSVFSLGEVKFSSKNLYPMLTVSGFGHRIHERWGDLTVTPDTASGIAALEREQMTKPRPMEVEGPALHQPYSKQHLSSSQ